MESTSLISRAGFLSGPVWPLKLFIYYNMLDRFKSVKPNEILSTDKVTVRKFYLQQINGGVLFTPLVSR